MQCRHFLKGTLFLPAPLPPRLPPALLKSVVVCSGAEKAPAASEECPPSTKRAQEPRGAGLLSSETFSVCQTFPALFSSGDVLVCGRPWFPELVFCRRNKLPLCSCGPAHSGKRLRSAW